MALNIHATVQIASIDGWASAKKSHSLCRSAVVLQASEHGVDVVQVARTSQVTTIVATQVVSFGEHGTEAVSSSIVRHNAVLKARGASGDVEDGASAEPGGIPRKRAIADYKQA